MASRRWREQVANQMTQSRFSAWLLSIFGALAMALAAVGIYSVMAYAVEQRSREIGVRMAMGASAGDVLKMVIGQGMRLALLGVALGLGAALALTQLMKRLLFGVATTDPADLWLDRLVVDAHRVVGLLDSGAACDKGGSDDSASV